MTMERILLQTIKFDLQVDHPYGQLLSFAKQIKGTVQFGTFQLQDSQSCQSNKKKELK
jgi:hypothetical protein